MSVSNKPVENRLELDFSSITERYGIGMEEEREVFSEGDYRWTEFWKDNDTSPPLYHGTRSVNREGILEEGLKPSKSDWANDYLEYLESVLDSYDIASGETDMFGRDNEERFRELHLEPIKDKQARDTKLLFLTFDPAKAVSYSKNAPEYLVDLKNAYNRAMEFIDDEESISNLEDRYKEIEENLEAAKESEPMIITVKTDLDRLDPLEPEKSDLEWFLDREKFEERNPFPNPSNDYRPLNVQTENSVPPEDITRITYIEPYEN
ncbi:MAG: hypothetical protein SVV03_01730 [Candidatus Nanohaloarchaea archaeon]|nr:hypothetical protein [Candidatus Nanohaloarchaea archaeon]